MTLDERVVFEELLRTSSKAVRVLGKQMPIPEILIYSQPFVIAANAAERILDPLRSPAERARIEQEIA